MKIIISPAKIQTGNTPMTLPLKQPAYNKQTTLLDKILSRMSKLSLGELMKIKGKLLDVTYENLHHKKGLKHAIDLYNGIVFKEINFGSYDDVQTSYMERHLRILSAYYGILEPTTGIHPYRLDMTMKPNQKNLYLYWDEVINQCFSDDEMIINLASIEYSKMVNKKMVNIFFKEEQSDGTMKIITVRAKRARGLMVDFLIANLVEDLNDLKKFAEADYEYNDELSDKSNLVFVIPYEK